MTNLREAASRLSEQNTAGLCEDCPPVGYPTDKTRCTPCPRRPQQPAPSPAWREAVARLFAQAVNFALAGAKAPGRIKSTDVAALYYADEVAALGLPSSPRDPSVLEKIARIARSDGNRTFDDCIRDLGLIDDLCRAALQEGEGT